MIKVTYHRHMHDVVVEGHAQSGEIGHDLVCASASILVYTLASFVENVKNAGQVYKPIVVIEEGNARISCDVPIHYIGSITLVFDSICAGFELLARDYPDNISYEIKSI